MANLVRPFMDGRNVVLDPSGKLSTVEDRVRLEDSLGLAAAHQGSGFLDVSNGLVVGIGFIGFHVILS